MISLLSRNYHHFPLEPCQNKHFQLCLEHMPGMKENAHFRTNSLGIRGTELSTFNRYRLLSIGCSVALSKYVDQDKFWGHCLGKLLSHHFESRAWVGVVGENELTSSDMVTLLRFFVPQISEKLDFLLVWIGINDIALALSKGGMYDPAYLDSKSTLYRLNRVFTSHPYSKTRSKTSNRVIRKLLSCIKHKIFADVFPSADAFYSEKRLRRQDAARLIDIAPNLSTSLDVYSQNIKTITYLAKRYSLPIAFVTPVALWKEVQPDFEERLLWFGWISDSDNFYTSGVLSEALRMFNQRLLTLCEDLGIECINLTNMLPKNTSVFYDDVHINVPGSFLVAQAIADRILML